MITGLVVRAGLDPSPDDARRLLEQELAKPEYHPPRSLVEQLLGRLQDWLASLGGAIALPSWASALVMALVLAVVAAVAYYAATRTRRQRRLSDTSGAAVLDEAGVSAAEYRSRAARARADGDWDLALVDTFRAIAASAQERTLLDDAPGRTAHEIAAELGRIFPARLPALGATAAVFDAVRYGDVHASGQDATDADELDRALSSARPAPAGATR